MLDSLRISQTQLIKESALHAGFDIVGIARAIELDEEFNHYLDWIEKGYHGTMGYLANNQEKRKNVQAIVPGAKSVIVVGLSYATPFQHKHEQGNGKISRYAWGTDYHEILPSMLSKIVAALQQIDPESSSRFYVDTGPLLEKQWAIKAGLGWQGKHSNIISRDIGSWFFIGVIITTVELKEDTPIEDFCGTCTACIDACPTKAITQPYVVDGTKCISYWTIETKPDIEIPQVIADSLDNWIFGCDVCQDICPWNRFEKPTRIKEFYPREEQTEFNLLSILTMNQQEFSKRFSKSAVKRTKLSGLQRNAKALLKDSDD